VTFEIADHPHDIRVTEARERARFLTKALESPAVILRLLMRDWDHRTVGCARGERSREVFLDRDILVQVRVARQIGNPERARAEQSGHAILHEYRAGGERVLV